MIHEPMARQSRQSGEGWCDQADPKMAPRFGARMSDMKMAVVEHLDFRFRERGPQAIGDFCDR